MTPAERATVDRLLRHQGEEAVFVADRAALEELARNPGFDPARVVGPAALAGPGLPDGVHGATEDGLVWHVWGGELITHRPRAADEPDATDLFPRPPVEVAPGAIHVPDWLPPARRGPLVQACRGWARSAGGLHHVTLPGGGVMSARSVRLEDPMPPELGELGREALQDAYGLDAPPAVAFDAALVNFYDDTATMGLHQDNEERPDAPVVSLSLGARCTFRLATPRHRGRPYTDVELRSGDLFVFGGPNRRAFHGVPKVHAGTGDPATGMAAGRLNLTLRVTGQAR